MDVLNLGPHWLTIESDSLDVHVTFDRHGITPVAVNLLNRPIQLRTPNLTLYLPQVIFGEDDRVEFSTGSYTVKLG